jgi:NTE family protein
MRASYATGMSGREIRDAVDDLVISEEDDWRKIRRNKHLGSIVDLIRPGSFRGSRLNRESVLAVLGRHLPVKTFAELSIPLAIVAADSWSRQQVVLETGDWLAAVAASSALPGLFKPMGKRLLGDGGTVSPVPFDLLEARSDISVAVHVLGARTRREGTEGPSFLIRLADQVAMQKVAIPRNHLWPNADFEKDRDA